METVSFDVATETFTVDLADQGQRAAVLAAIRRLGYKPTLLDAAPANGTDPPARPKAFSAPSLVAALARARARDVPLVVDFGGAFCSACKAFKRDVLGDAGVQQALRAFEFLEIDVEQDTAAASELGVTAVPDIWILSPSGVALARENRTMNTEEFLLVLDKHAPR